MARIRSIKPEFPQSESMGKVSRDARLLFVQLWTLCDDSGRTRGVSRMLASLLFPYDDDAPKLIDRWLAELEREGCIIRYLHDGNSYIQVCNWLNHQKIDKPSQSKIPPPENPREDSPKSREPSSLDQGSRIKDQGGDQGEDHSLAQPPEPVVPVPPPVIGIPLNDGSEYGVTDEQVREFAALYQSVDVMQELRSMRAWGISNPTKRKTRAGVMRFVNAWLAKEQDSPRRSGGAKSSNNSLREIGA